MPAAAAAAVTPAPAAPATAEAPPANDNQEVPANDAVEGSAAAGAVEGAPGAAEGGAGAEGSQLEDGAEGEGKPIKALPPSLKAAIRLDKKAKAALSEAAAAEGRAKVAVEQAQAREQALTAQVEGWKRQVEPALKRLSQLEGAAKAGRVGDVVRALGLEPRAVLDALAEEAANPVPPEVRRELEEARAEREARKAAEEAQKSQEAERQKTQQARQADWGKMAAALEMGDFPGLEKYHGEHGPQAMLDEAYDVQRQLKEAGRPVTMKSLLSELEARASKFYGLKPASAAAAATSAVPAPKAGQGQPGNSAAPAAPAPGRRPGAVTSAMAASSSGEGTEKVLTDQEYKEAALRALRESRRGKKLARSRAAEGVHMGNADITVASFLQTVKIQWPQARLDRRLLEENPGVAMIPIKPFAGRTVYLVAQYSGQQGRSADFGKALANRAASQQVAFILTTVHDYATGGVDGETLEAIEDDESLVDGINGEMDSSFYTMQRSLAVHVFGDGTGAIGRVGTDTSATSFVLANPYDAVNFMNGQILIANPTKTGAAGSIIAGTGKVTGVDETSGLITYEALGGWNPSANDYIYVDGDYDAKAKGLAAWLPETTPTAGDSFFSVDRSVHPTRLAGYRFDGSAMLPEEAIEKGLAHAGTFGCRPDLILVNPMDYYAMKRSLGNRAIIDLAKSPNDVNVGFDAIVFVSRNKKVRVIEDHGCPKGIAYALNTKKVAIYARKKSVVRLLNKDGQELRADANADAYIWRLGGYFQMGMEDPGAHLRIKLPTT